MSIGIALAGPGAFGRKHLDALKQIEDAAATVIVDPNIDVAQKVAADYGVADAVNDLDKALAMDSVDAVILATPTQMHAEQAIQCMRAGKHVEVEIPVADSLADAEEVLRVQQETGLVCAVGHTRVLVAVTVRVGARRSAHPADLVAKLGGAGGRPGRAAEDVRSGSPWRAELGAVAKLTIVALSGRRAAEPLIGLPGVGGRFVGAAAGRAQGEERERGTEIRYGTRAWGGAAAHPAQPITPNRGGRMSELLSSRFNISLMTFRWFGSSPSSKGVRIQTKSSTL